MSVLDPTRNALIVLGRTAAILSIGAGIDRLLGRMTAKRARAVVRCVWSGFTPAVHFLVVALLAILGLMEFATLT